MSQVIVENQVEHRLIFSTHISGRHTCLVNVDYELDPRNIKVGEKDDQLEL